MGFAITGTRGTVVGVPEEDFDPEAASQQLYDGMKGLGTNERAIIEVVGGHNNAQRQIIKEKYKTMFGMHLDDHFKDELGGSFRKVVLGLMKDPEEYIIDGIEKAIKGLGTDEKALIALLCGRSNEELAEMKAAYSEKYGKDVEEEIADDLSGDLKKFMISLMSGGRDESEEVDEELVNQDAQDLYEASIGPGTTESVFNTIFNLRSPNHMRKLFDVYQDMAEGKTMEELIESEFSGDLKKAYLTLIGMTRNVVVFYAERLNYALSGFGTDDETLMRIIISRSEVDLQDIAEYYAIKYEKSLEEAIASDTKGDYRRILLKIVGGTEESE